LKGSGFAIGHASDTAIEVIQKEYKKDLTIDNALGLAKKAIEEAIGEKPIVESGIVTKEGFSKLS